jgi:LPXTG-motif cell wall-anchored protein
MGKVKFAVLLSFLLILTLAQTPFLETGANEAPKVLDISTFPQDTFIEMNNLKPGDSVISSIKIKNDGNVDFIYNGRSSLKEGSEKYYNQLLLTITDSQNKVLFDGLVKDFKFFDSRKINYSSSDNLKIIMKVPDLGNEYQELFATILFTFFVEGENPSDPPGDNEPPTDDHEPPGTNKQPSKDTGSLPQTGEDNPIFIILSGLFISMAGIALLLIKKSILPNPFKRV